MLKENLILTLRKQVVAARKTPLQIELLVSVYETNAISTND
jgi:hypothetical protein